MTLRTKSIYIIYPKGNKNAISLTFGRRIGKAAGDLESTAAFDSQLEKWFSHDLFKF
jgi:Tfp pilus assembly protein PilF